MPNSFPGSVVSGRAAGADIIPSSHDLEQNRYALSVLCIGFTSFNLEERVPILSSTPLAVALEK